MIPQSRSRNAPIVKSQCSNREVAMPHFWSECPSDLLLVKHVKTQNNCNWNTFNNVTKKMLVLYKICYIYIAARNKYNLKKDVSIQ